MRSFDLVFLHGAGYPGNPCYGGQAYLGNQHNAEKLSPRITLHFHKVRKKINATKVVSIALVLWFALFHGIIIHIFYGVTPCKGLLEDGMYKEGGGGLWQPWGCMMHRYSKS